MIKTLYMDSIEIKFINDIIKSFFDKKFSDINDVTLENLREFLIPIFEGYKNGSINHLVFVEIADVLDKYITVKFGDEGSDEEGIADMVEKYATVKFEPSVPIQVVSSPYFEDSDDRSIGLEAIEYMSAMTRKFFMFPEDIPYFIEFLKTHAGKELEAHQKIKEYVCQFDYTKRLEEAHKRGYIYFQNRGSDPKTPTFPIIYKISS